MTAVVAVIVGTVTLVIVVIVGTVTLLVVLAVVVVVVAVIGMVVMGGEHTKPSLNAVQSPCSLSYEN